MAINVTVAEASPLDSNTPDALLVFSFTNTAPFTYAADSEIYYYALLTDSTPAGSITKEFTFVVPKTGSATIPGGTTEKFEIENSTPLITPITVTDGRICYVKQS